jgi:hypothetical protein
MPHTLGTLLIAGVLSLGLTAAAITWLDNAEETLLLSAADASRDSGIEKVDVEFGRKQIYLNVHLTKPLSCLQVIDLLGIESLPIKDKVFVPTCSKPTGNLMKIVFNEAVMV